MANPGDKDLEKYLRILERLRSGKAVSNEEIKHFASFSQDIDEEKLAKIREKLSTKDGFKKVTDEDVASYIDEAKKALASDTYKTQTLDLAKDAEAGRVSDRVATGLNTLLSGMDIAASNKQIAAANKLASTPKPGRPAIPTQDTMLAQALNQAQQGTFDQSRALQPAQLGILNNYLSDINNAKQASSGQSGIYGSLAQVASNRRNAANQELMPLADSIKAREQGRLDSLIGMRMDQTQNNFNNQNSLYNNDLNQYNLDQQAAGALGATGRANLRNSYANLGQQIPAIAGQIAAAKYDNIYNQMANYGHDNAMTAVNAHKEIDNRYKNPYSDLTSDDSIQQINQAY